MVKTACGNGVKEFHNVTEAKQQGRRLNEMLRDVWVQGIVDVLLQGASTVKIFCQMPYDALHHANDHSCVMCVVVCLVSPRLPFQDPQ